MGNCIDAAFALPHNDKQVRHDQEDQELQASAVTLAAVLKSGEACHVSPQLIQQRGLQAQLDAAKSSNGQKVKIVVNKKQLQLLIRTVEELKSRHIVIQSIGKRGKKWRPSLATVPEL